MTSSCYIENLTIVKHITSGKHAREIYTHFYIEKLGFAGEYLIFLFLIQNIHCGYSLELLQQGSSNMYPQCMF